MHSLCLHLLAPPSPFLSFVSFPPFSFPPFSFPPFSFLLSLSSFSLSFCPSVSTSFLGSVFTLCFSYVQLREIEVIADIVLPRDIVIVAWPWCWCRNLFLFNHFISLNLAARYWLVHIEMEQHALLEVLESIKGHGVTCGMWTALVPVGVAGDFSISWWS